MRNLHLTYYSTAIPYRVSTGSEQGFPCVLFPNREKPVFITGIPANENRFFPVGKSTQGNPCFHYRAGFAVCSQLYGRHSNSNVNLNCFWPQCALLHKLSPTKLSNPSKRTPAVKTQQKANLDNDYDM